MGNGIVTVDNLGYCYRPDRWVFRNYSASVARGRVFAILGPNGCGKTTLLKLLLGALKPSEGRLTVVGKAALVPQLFQVSFDFSALDMVLMGRANKIKLFAQPSRRDEQAALAALDRFGMADLAARPFHEMSGGQRQLVIFARALVAEPQILILDEPTSSLDFGNQALVLEWIDTLSRSDGLTVVMSTHHPHHAVAIADEALLMLGKNGFACGPACDVLTEENLETLYGVQLKRVSYEYRGRQVDSFVQAFPPYGGERSIAASIGGGADGG